MGQCDRVKQEERLTGVFFHPPDHIVLNQGLRVGLSDRPAVVPRQQEWPVVVVQVSRKIAVRVTLAVVAEEMVDALIHRTAAGIKESHAPFAEGRGRVARRLGNLRDRHGFVGQRELAFRRDFVVTANRTVSAVQARKERRPTGGTHAGSTVRLHVPRPLGGHSVQPGCLNQLLSVAPQVALGDVIAEHKNHIRRTRRGDNTSRNQ